METVEETRELADFQAMAPVPEPPVEPPVFAARDGRRGRRLRLAGRGLAAITALWLAALLAGALGVGGLPALPPLVGGASGDSPIQKKAGADRAGPVAGLRVALLAAPDRLAAVTAAASIDSPPRRPPASAGDGAGTALEPAQRPAAAGPTASAPAATSQAAANPTAVTPAPSGHGRAVGRAGTPPAPAAGRESPGSTGETPAAANSQPPGPPATPGSRGHRYGADKPR